MGADTRLAVVLFGSFVLWIPALSSVLRGELDAEVAGIRWGIGAALVWAMVAALNQLIAGYAVAAAEDRPARRATDHAPDAVDAGESGDERVAEEQDVDDGAGLLDDATTMEPV